MKKYTKTHEWISVEGDVAVVGITDHAQEKLGDVVYVNLPAVGKTVKKGEVLATIESVKSAADVYAPVSGEVTEVNDRLRSEPELVNKSPEGEGWLVKMKVFDLGELNDLLDEPAYRKFCEEEG